MPQPDPVGNAGKPDADGNSHSYNNTTSIGYTYCDRDGNSDNTSGFAYSVTDPASADAKAAAHAVSSADAPVMVVKG